MSSNREIEERLRRACENATPDVLPSVLSQCGRQRKGNVIDMKEATIKRKPVLKSRILSAAAACALLVAVLGGLGVYNANYAVASTVSIDVNPSVRIEVNQKERVLAVDSLNEDGKTVLGNMNLKGSDLNVAVNALIGSMVRNGYLSELANSVLISVNHDDPQKGAALQQKLAHEVNGLLEAEPFGGAVLSQTLSHDDEVNELAAAYGVSEGKAGLIKKLMAQNPLRTFEGLAALSINELNLLGASGAAALEQVEAIGSASDKAYIGREKALELALARAEVAESEASRIEVELDCDDGKMVYEVEFLAAGSEYEAELDARTGEVLEFNRDDHDDNNRDDDRYDDDNRDDDRDDDDNDRRKTAAPQTANAPSSTKAPSAGNLLSGEKARGIVLAHAGVSAGSAQDYDAELERENGRAVYEIDFKADGWEYEYEIDAETGEILRHEKELDD